MNTPTMRDVAISCSTKRSDNYWITAVLGANGNIWFYERAEIKSIHPLKSFSILYRDVLLSLPLPKIRGCISSLPLC